VLFSIIKLSVCLGTYQAPKAGSDYKHRLIFLLYQSNKQIPSTPTIEQEKCRQFPLKQFDFT
jgi:hypothetical protein